MVTEGTISSSWNCKRCARAPPSKLGGTSRETHSLLFSVPISCRGFRRHGQRHGRRGPADQSVARDRRRRRRGGLPFGGGARPRGRPAGGLVLGQRLPAHSAQPLPLVQPGRQRGRRSDRRGQQHGGRATRRRPGQRGPARNQPARRGCPGHDDHAQRGALVGRHGLCQRQSAGRFPGLHRRARRGRPGGTARHPQHRRLLDHRPHRTDHRHRRLQPLGAQHRDRAGRRRRHPRCDRCHDRRDAHP